MKLKAVTALTLLTLGACSGADTSGIFMAANGYRVLPTADPNRFEVLARAGAGGSDYYCAAADYAFRRLDASPADRVVVQSSPSVGQRTGSLSAFFSVAKQGSVPRSNTLHYSMQPGQNAQIGLARQNCRKNTFKNDND
ncbi:hypothetical protein [Meridianimarinicoccus sp. MJW13]|uniref:hypothetical protein n=1 Tax=Meridianimarinicoccus sp. MJW13 TaxID=2720031 RepID=UPI0018686D3C|nr:hypothetical protein [Fluviibacterium sp. MJW13]